MNRLRGRKRAHKRAHATGINWDVSASSQLANPSRISLGLSEGQIAGDRNNPEHLQLISRRQSQQDRNGVVQSRISIDDDLARQGSLLWQAGEKVVSYTARTAASPKFSRVFRQAILESNLRHPASGASVSSAWPSAACGHVSRTDLG
jgi:hypothetical protein